MLELTEYICSRCEISALTLSEPLLPLLSKERKAAHKLEEVVGDEGWGLRHLGDWGRGMIWGEGHKLSGTSLTESLGGYVT